MMQGDCVAKRLRLRLLACLFVMWPCATVFAQTADDVVGLRLGMSEDQVIAALEAHDPAARIEVYEASYNFNDGATLQQSPPFLDFIRAHGAAGERITVKFAPGAGPPRAVSIIRGTVMNQAPPTRAQLVAALEGKYGAPNETGRASGMPAMLWLDGDKTNCVVDSGVGYIAPSPDTPDFMGWLARSPGAADNGAGCARVLLAQLDINDPVRLLTLILTDIAGWAAAEIAAQDWVEQLEVEAVEARKARGAAPRL